MNIDSHQKILEDLIQGNAKAVQIDQRIQSLDIERFDIEPLVILQLKQIKNTLEKYISQEWSAEDVEDWANLIESYDDIAFEEKHAEQIAQLIYELATPEFEEELTIEKANELIELIS
jgi:hypothetical protein